MMDLSEIRRLHEESKRETRTASAVRETLMVVFEMVPIAFVAMSGDGKILYASPAYERIVGQGGTCLSGYAWYATIHSDDREKVARQFGEFVEQADPRREWSMVCRLARVDDGAASAPVLVTARIVGSEEGGTPSVVLAFQFNGTCLIDDGTPCLHTGTTRWLEKISAKATG